MATPAQAAPAAASAAPKSKANPFNDPKAMAAMGLERTNNKKGFMFLRIGESASYWLNSLPHSSSPLLDLGAAYGVHTIHALKAGRDVVAVDMDEVHIAELRVRVDDYLRSPAAQNGAGPGRLVDATVATLPEPAICQEDSVAGVLVAEVLHFMKPGQLQPLFSDIYRWLEPGGRVVVTAAASQRAKVEVFTSKMGYKLSNDRTVDDVDKMISTASGEELAKAAPAFMELPEASPFRANVNSHLYLMSTKEVKAFAKEAGFQIERCSYITPQKYPDKKVEGETVLLVARKPDPRKQKQKLWAAAAATAAATSILVFQFCRKR